MSGVPDMANMLVDSFTSIDRLRFSSLVVFGGMCVCLKELSFGKTCSACRRGQNANKKFTDFVLKYPVDFMSNLETSRVSDYWRRWR